MMTNPHAVVIDQLKGSIYYYRKAVEIAALLRADESDGWQYVVQGDANLEFGKIAVYDAAANFLGHF